MPGEAERKERLLALIDGFSSRRVLIVGDLIADEFIYGDIARVSREAPVLILKYDGTEMLAGGAGNAANNVAALGGRARLAGLVGPMPKGGGCWPASSRRRTRAHRAGEVGTGRRSRRAFSPAASTRRRQQVVRIDREAGWPLAGEVSRAFAKKLPALADRATPSCCPTTDPGSSRRRSPKRCGRRSRSARGAARFPWSSIRATGCSTITA